MSVPGRRFVLVDAVRGLAALAVAAYHFGTSDLERPLAALLSHYVTGAFERGWIGVHVFFTLSGFVIAHSLGDGAMTWPRAARFFVRRQLRLDPPYWLALAVTIGIALYWRVHQPAVPRFVPGPALIAEHVLYVYDLMGRRPILGIVWSLAIEVQFYLAFVVLLALLRRVPRALPWLLATTAVLSLYSSMTWRYPHAWGTQHWFLFALGVLVRWGLDRRAPAWLAPALAVGYVVAGVHYDRLEPIAGAATALLLFVAGRRDGLTRWLGARPLQWLGRASYSVYLFHTIVGGQVRGHLDGHMNAHRPLGALVAFLAEIIATLLVAAVVHRTVERWSIELAGRIDWKRGGTSPRTPAP